MSAPGAPMSPSAFSRISDDDLYLFNEGTHRRMGDKLGAHIRPEGGVSFGVWAPNATRVAVIGDFNYWAHDADVLAPRGESGIWEGVVEAARPGHNYKFAITTQSGDVLEKADPFAFRAEHPPRTGSVVWDLAYEWGDHEWMRSRGEYVALGAPVSVYEVHLGSWRRDPADPERFLSYTEVAEPLIRHVHAAGFTHVEFLPLMEHPFYGSWGYQTTGFFAPTSRYGTPQDLMGLIDQLHQAGIGVLFDWVPSHFPEDSFALAQFDGTHLFDHADPRLGFTGSPNTTSTVYGSMLWRPCSTWTTPADPANGSPTSSGAARTSRRSNSCATSTRGSMPTIPT